MSTRQKGLTKLQEQIIDALANDYESLVQIREMLEHSVAEAQIENTLWTLIQDGYVACYGPTPAEMRIVPQPKRQKLADYWFALTKSGTQLLAALEAHR